MPPLSHEEAEEAAHAIERFERASLGGLPAFERVLVATDGSVASRHAIEWARELGRDSTLWVAHVAEVPQTGSRGILELARAELGVPDDRALLAYGQAASEIVKMADDLRASVVVVGSHGRSMTDRLVLGSVSDAVRRGVRTSILVARSSPSSGPVLAAIDGSANSTRAAGVAARLAARRGCELVLLHVTSAVEPGTWTAAPQGRLTEVVLSGDPVERIVAEARARKASLVVMGARGHGRVRSTIMGSVSTAVCHKAPTSVLVVRGPLG